MAPGATWVVQAKAIYNREPSFQHPDVKILAKALPAPGSVKDQPVTHGSARAQRLVGFKHTALATTHHDWGQASCWVQQEQDHFISNATRALTEGGDALAFLPLVTTRSISLAMNQREQPGPQHQVDCVQENRRLAETAQLADVFVHFPSTD